MLREAKNARFEPEQTWLGKRWRFVFGRKSTNPWSEVDFIRLIRQQMASPIALVTDERKVYWAYRDRFYWTDDDLTPDDVEALIVSRQRQRERQLSHARAMRDVATGTSTRRETIPQAVKEEVWRRDSGRCATCGGQERIEFDHIIPLAMGGSNTVRNLQLLCERCNRQKSASI